MCYVEPERQRLTFAGARFDLCILGDGDPEIIRGTKAGIGYHGLPPTQKYDKRTIHLEPGQTFYIFSDGIPDQIGGERRRAFGKKRLYRTLADLGDLPLEEQMARFMDTFRAYQGDELWRDDVSMIGFRPLAPTVRRLRSRYRASKRL